MRALLLVVCMIGGASAATTVSETQATIPSAFAFTAQTNFKYKFKCDKAMAAGDSVTLVLPKYTIALTKGCEVAASTSSVQKIVVANSGQAAASLQIFLGSPLAANTAIEFTIASGISTGAALGANHATMTNAFTIAGEDNVAATRILTTAAVVAGPVLSAVSIVPTSAKTNAVSAMTLSFTNDKEMEVGSTITFTLAQYTFGTLPTPAGGCLAAAGGAKTFTVAAANSGTANAQLTFTLAGNKLSAATACQITLASGITLPATDAKTGNKISVVSPLGGSDPAEAIDTNTAVAAGGAITATAVTYAVAKVGAATSFTYSFTSASVLAAGFTAKVVLPNVVFGTLSAVTGGCKAAAGGGKTFTVAKENSGTANAALTFTSAGNALNAATACELIVATGVTTGSAAVGANSAAIKNTIIGDTGSNTAAGGTQVATSTATVAATTASSALTFATAIAGAASSVTYTFKTANTDPSTLAVGDSVAVTLPGFTFGTLATVTGGCVGGGKTWTVAKANSGTATAALTFTLGGAALPKNTDCVLTVATGVTLPAAASAADVATRKATVTLAASANIADITTTSTAIVAPGFHTNALVVTTPVQGSKTSITYTFKTLANNEMAVGDKIKITLPNFTFGTLAAVTGGCLTAAGGAKTFTTAASGSGTATAAIEFTIAGNKLNAATECALTIATGVTVAKATQVANLATRTVAITAASGASVPATAIGTSTATYLVLTNSALTVATATTATASSITYTLKANVDLAVGDKVKITLPGFTLGTLATVTGGCLTAAGGAKTFTTAASGSGTATAAIEFTIAGNKLTKDTECALTIATGVTTAATAQVANLATRTAAVTVAGGDDMPAYAITTSTALTAPSLATNSLVIATAKAGATSSITYTFKTSAGVEMAVGDTIKVTLPGFTLGTLATVTGGCLTAAGGAKTFTTAASGSGTATAAITFTIAGNKLNAATECALTIATGVTTAATAQAANLATRKVEISIAGNANIASTTINPSTETKIASLIGNALTSTSKIANTATSITYTFKMANNGIGLAIADKVKITLPKFTFGTLATVTGGCVGGGKTWTVAKANSGTDTASLEFTLGGAALAANTVCALTVATGVTTPTVAQTANLNTRKVEVTLAGTSNVAATAITTSDLVDLSGPARASEEFVVASPGLNTASSISYKFTANQIINTGDTIKLVLPKFQFGTLAAVTGTLAATTWTVASANSGADTASLTFTATNAFDGAGKPAATALVLTIATGVTTPVAAQAANLATRTAEFTFCGATNYAAAAIKTSPQIGLVKVLTIATPQAGVASSYSFAFTYDKAMAVNDIMTLVLPGTTFGTLAAVTKVGCGTTTWEVAKSNSGTATATLAFTAKTATLTAYTACTVIVATGVTNSATAVDANKDTRTVAFTAAAGNAAAAAITTSTAVALPTLTTSELTISSTKLDTTADVSFKFAADVAFAACDKMTLALAGMSAAATKLTSTVAATGGATCAAADAFFASGKLYLTFNGAVDTKAAGKFCTYTIKSIKTAKAYVAENAATRTAAVTIAGIPDIVATKITKSTITGVAPKAPTASASATAGGASGAGGAGYTSGASSYASGKPSVTPASTVKHFVTAQVKLSGITKDQFDAAAKTAFKEVVATGITGAVAADVTITAVTDARRAGIKVDFKVQVKDKAAATAGAAKLNTFLTTGTKFKDALVAKGGNLAKVTGTEVTIAPKATTESTVSGVANTAAMSLISMVAAGLALLR